MCLGQNLVYSQEYSAQYLTYYCTETSPPPPPPPLHPITGREEREKKVILVHIIIFCCLLYHLQYMAFIPKVLHVSVAAEVPPSHLKARKQRF